MGGEGLRPDAVLFGEVPGRVIVTVKDLKAAQAAAKESELTLKYLASVGGSSISIGEYSISLEAAQLAYETAIPTAMQ